MNPTRESSITEGLHRALHYHPQSYWCPGCWKFVLDCSHLAEPLDRPRMKLAGGTFIEAAYDRGRRILEVWTNTGDAFQYQGVSLELARQFARSERPREFIAERLPRAKLSRVRRKR